MTKSVVAVLPPEGVLVVGGPFAGAAAVVDGPSAEGPAEVGGVSAGELPAGAAAALQRPHVWLQKPEAVMKDWVQAPKAFCCAQV